MINEDPADDYGGSDDEYLATILERAILDGTYPTGHKFEEADVAAEYNATTSAVRKALERLAEYQLVDRGPRRGTVVREVVERVMSDSVYRAAVDPDRADVPAHQEISGEARTVDRVLHVMDAKDAPEEIVRALNLRADDKVVGRRFLCREFGRPTSLVVSWIPLDLIEGTPFVTEDYVPGPADPVDILMLLGKNVSHFDDEVTQRLPTRDEANDETGLAISPNLRVSVRHRLTYADGKVVEVNQAVSHILTKYQYRVHLRAPDAGGADGASS